MVGDVRIDKSNEYYSSIAHLQQSTVKKFVKLCQVLSDIQSYISNEDKIANVTEASYQVGLRAAAEVSKSVQKNICDWVSIFLFQSVSSYVVYRMFSDYMHIHTCPYGPTLTETVHTQMNDQVGGSLMINGSCSVTEMNKLCAGMK